MKNLLKLSLMLFLMYSCSNEEFQSDISDSEISEVSYEYSSKIYSESEFKQKHSELFLTTHQVYDLDRNVIIFFDDKQKADLYKAADPKTLDVSKSPINDERSVDSRAPLCDPFFSYGVTFFEYKWFKGKSIRFVKNNVDVRKVPDGVIYALPNHWKNRISSFKAFSSNQVLLKYNWGCGVEPTRLILEDINKDNQHIFDIMDYSTTPYQAKTQVGDLKGSPQWGNLNLNNNIDNFGIVVYAL